MHPGIEGRDYDAGMPEKWIEEFLVKRLVAQNDPTHAAALAIYVFGGRVGHNIGAQFNRIDQHRVASLPPGHAFAQFRNLASEIAQVD